MRFITNAIVLIVFFLLPGFLIGKGKENRQHSLYATLFSAGRIAGEVFSSHQDSYNIGENPVLIIQPKASLNKRFMVLDESEIRINSRSRQDDIENVQKLNRPEKNLAPRSAESAGSSISISHLPDSRSDFEQIKTSSEMATEQIEYLISRSILIVEPEVNKRASVFSRTGSNW